MENAKVLEIGASQRTIRSDRTGHERVCHYCPERPYIELLVPDEVKHVRRVIFTTISCDQGYSDESNSNPSLRGSYDHGFSWFEACVTAPSGRERFPRRLLLRNAHGIQEPRQHIIEWTDDNSDEFVRQWIQSIRSGDRIQIIAKARHQGWHNNVIAAKIEAFGHGRAQSSEINAPLRAHTSLYRALETTKTIRLLTIYPGTFTEPLHCTLHHSPLGSALQHEYECLSYCWGDRRNAKTLHLSYGLSKDMEGYQPPVAVIQITSNLNGALHRLRHTDRPRIMWIDALCINQADPHECSQQVSMMREIYSRATSVIVWLANRSHELDQCLADASMIRERYKELETPEGADTTKLHKPLLDEGSYHVDTPMFRNEYFKRAWVLQEVFNANEVTVLYDDEVVPWHLILRLNECIARSTVYSNPVAKNAMPPLFAELFSPDKSNNSCAAYSTSYISEPVRRAILDVILEGLDLEATDPRDKIFALLSFGEETSNFSSHSPEIRPNYTKTTARVFADFTRWWIRTHESLEILSAVHVARGRTWMALELDRNLDTVDDRPSWSLWHTGRSVWAQGRLLSSRSPYHASRHTKATTRDTEDELVLSLLGRRISSIAEISEYPYYQTYFGHIENSEHPRECSKRAIYDAYVHLCDPLAWQGTWTSRLQRSDMQELRQPYDRDSTYQKNLDHLKAHAIFSPQQPGRIDLQQNASIGCHGPCYFRTSDGIEGLCPPAAKPGDWIALMYGGDVPYLIRPQDSPDALGKRFAFIGECYLDGYMHGLALDSQTEEQWFDLI